MEHIQLVAATEEGNCKDLPLTDGKSKRRRKSGSFPCSTNNGHSSTEIRNAVLSLTDKLISSSKEELGNESGNKEFEMYGTKIQISADLHKEPDIQSPSMNRSLDNLHNLTPANSESDGNGTSVWCSQDNLVKQFSSAPDNQVHLIRRRELTVSGPLAQGNVMDPYNNLNEQNAVINALGKRKLLRLLKNREAVKECRRKKKEYVRWLEERVGILEDQNRVLMEQLKTWKQSHHQQKDI